MKRVLAVLLFALLVSSSFAAHVVIIESTSFDPTHLMDQNWANVSTSMGHTFSLLPQTALDNNAFFAICDLLIVSSGVIPLNPTRQNMIRQAYAAGIPVYLQSESDVTYDTNQTWVGLVQDAAGSFVWNGSTSGLLEPMRVSGTVSTTSNTVNQLVGFVDGAYGTGSREVETNLHFGDQEYGWYVRPLVTGAITLAATTTDQEWVNGLSDPSLMENYITNLLAFNASELQVRCWTNGPPIVIPSTGGSFSYQALAYNTGFSSITFDAWSQVELPNGNLVGPLAFFPGLTLPAQAVSNTTTLNQAVPGFAPAGTYFLLAGVGSWTNYRTNLDAIRFVKQ